MLFSGFKQSIPQISIFHNAASPPSRTALALLESALSGPYPPGGKSKAPLNFKLEVVESSPNPDQLKTIMNYAPKGRTPSSLFLSAHPSATSNSSNQFPTLSSISTMAKENPNAFKWPVVVDWLSGKAAVGSVEEVKGILEHVRKLRDGEIKQDETDQPKGWFS